MTKILMTWKKKGLKQEDGWESVTEWISPQALGIFVAEIVEGGLAAKIVIEVVD